MRHSEITEWWDHGGFHHEGHPSPEDLLDRATQVTGHIWNDEGDDLYFTSFSDDGWTDEEWAADVDDAGDHYGAAN